MRRPAFTMLELVLSMTIVAVCMALAAPRFADIRDAAAVQGAIRELDGSFSEARQMAIARAMAVAVVIDTVHDAIHLRSLGTAISGRNLGVVYGVHLGSNRDSAVYDPRGLGYGLSNLRLTVRRGRRADTLTVSRLGRVRW